jgi:HlyD family secretion protein
LVRTDDSAYLIARLILPDPMVRDVRANQDAIVGMRIHNSLRPEKSDSNVVLIKGHVSRVSAPLSDGMRSVDIALDSADIAPDATLPEGGGAAGSQIDGTIDIEKLEDILYVGRPIHGMPNTSIFLFKVVSDGAEAEKVNVKFGRASVQTIEVLDGLKAADRIILSDMSNWGNVDRIHLKP